ncbi:MAG: hypothetical protein K2P42_04600, partial [Lachnospiraceae bacterium]|nr:hypothetical protein [Lachnospiraceae bacterium]
YIDTYNANLDKDKPVIDNRPRANHGQVNNVDSILNKQYVFWFDPKRTIIYEMHDDSPGMIYYKLESEGGQKQTESELDETTENVLTAMLMATAILTRKGMEVEGLPVMNEQQENEFLLDKDTQNFLAMILMGAAATAEKAAEIGAAVIDGLFFLPIPDVLLENFMRTGSGVCDA